MASEYYWECFVYISNVIKWNKCILRELLLFNLTICGIIVLPCFFIKHAKSTPCKSVKNSIWLDNV